MTTEQLAAAATIAIFIGVGWILVRGLLAAARYEQTVMVTLSLSVLTLAAILAAAVSDSEAFIALAGTGLGALASSLTSIFDTRSKSKEGSNDVGD